MTENSKSKATASADMTRMLFQFAARQGVDLHHLETVAKIDRFNLEKRIPIQTYDIIGREIQKITGDNDFGIHLGETFVALSEGHLLFAVMRNCPTIGAALEKFFHYHSLISDTTTPRLFHENKTVICTFEPSFPYIRLNRHHTESIFSIVASILKRLSEGRIQLLCVNFQHTEPESLSEHRRVFDAPLYFAQKNNSLMIAEEDLSKSIFLANPDFLYAHEGVARKLMTRMETAGTLSGRVREVIGKSIARGAFPSLENIAGELAVSTRKLQAVLKEEKTCFRKILNNIRRELAQQYLKDPEISICDIAFLLGFSEQSAFNHAFRRWTGVTPRVYRKQEIMGQPVDP
ncbi:MAG: AraC family transcriptional regulator [Deltaproteobacteria bacterium]|nr:AraC family transcriptional regulator [Deltaproteobacteria bacterium]